LLDLLDGTRPGHNCNCVQPGSHSPLRARRTFCAIQAVHCDVVLVTKQGITNVTCDFVQPQAVPRVAQHARMRTVKSRSLWFAGKAAIVHVANVAKVRISVVIIIYLSKQ
jgi:hypothetical protein